MAGIAGYFGPAREPEVLQAMVRKLAHRGRGGEAFYLGNPVFMGMRGTAQDEQQQPAYRHDDSVVVLFSGVIVNYASLREDLLRKGIHFRTDSVAELVLHLYEVYGLNVTAHLRGRFVFAVHDTLKNFVFIARDRMGREPLYYTTTSSGTFVFASEVKALLEHPGVQATADMRAVDAYLSMGYSPGPGTFFKGVHKLPAGHRLIWNPGLHVMIEPYWQWESYMHGDPSLKTEDDYAERYHDMLDETIERATIGLSNPGIALSGSVEESVIANALVKNTGRSLESFTVGFDDGEAALAPAREIARKLGTRHTELICAPQDMAKLPEIVWALDEPVADVSALPSYMLMQRSAQSTDGIARGNGANEMMGGLLPQDVFQRVSHLKGLHGGIYGMAARFMPDSWLEKQYDFSGSLGPRRRERLLALLRETRKGSGIARRYNMICAVFGHRDKMQAYSPLLSPVMDSYIDGRKDPAGWHSDFATMLALQRDNALSDNTLMQADKLAGLASVDQRLPFMDHALVEFTLGLPDRLKYHEGKGKVGLRSYLQRYVPGLPEISRRDAEMPLHRYMTSRTMRDIVETCLSERAVASRGLFKPEAIRARINESREGDMICLRQVFALTMLELWFRVYIDGEKGWGH
ncbi:MAG: asparagine synthase (glutamine-hydrolyzing) [Bdellovibrionales bacterium]|jgi:asparagine synthase (glutamine-hydrolysing)|nr:asparagine synthase (glutamine-hydrolyzing) [Bdellovibrionales bacterium]